MSKREKNTTMASFEDLLQCSVCLERFTSPKALPCLHTFCLSCLKGIIKNAKTLDCPTCRRTHQVPENGAAGFLDNLMALNLLSMVGVSTPCSDCGSQQALSQCEHCQHEVCPDCRVAHNLLKAEIATLIDLIEKTIPEKTDDEETESARSSLSKILEAETNVKKAYTKAVETLTERRDGFLRRFNTLAKFQKAIVEEEKGPVIEGVRQELANCRTIQTLQELKNSLSTVEEMMNGGLLPDMKEFDDFGFGKDFLTTEAIGVKSVGEIALASGGVDDGGSATTAIASASILASGLQGTEKGLPSNVDYKAKQHLWKLTIGTPAEGCDEFKPTRAIYSPLEDAIYCLSKAKVLRYDAKSGVGKIVCSIFEAKDMALADSGSLILIDEQHIVKITADRLKNPKEEAFTFDLANLPAGTNATQVCCFGKEVIVLDSAKSRFLRFSESGKFINEIKPDGVLLNVSSSMCVDREGRIYLFSFHLNREDSRTVWNQCYKEPKSVTLTFECVLMIVNMDGVVKSTFHGLTNPPVTRSFGYTTHVEVCSKGCGNKHTRIDKGSVPDDKIIPDASNVSPVKMLCVDFDGYVSVTRAGKNQIDVYDPKSKLHCTIGDAKKSEFQEPTGLSLMPDGRLVVCDTGNNRILIT